MICGTLVFAEALCAPFVRPPIALTGFAICAFVLQLIQICFKLRASYFFSFANEARRLHHLEDGLGLNPSQLEIKRIQEVTPLTNEPYDRTYFASRSPQGFRRFIENLEESAFYSEVLACHCRRLFLIASVVGAVAAITALLIALLLNASLERGAIIDQLVVSTLAFFLAGDLAIMCYQFHLLAKAAGQSVAEANWLLRQRDIGSEKAHSLSLSYNSAIAQAPAILIPIYRRNKSKIEKSFSTYKREPRKF